MQSAARILIFGRDHLLLESRRLVLQKAGFEVLIATTLDQVHDSLSGEAKPLLILCHSLLKEDSHAALHQATQARLSKKPLVLTAGEVASTTNDDHEVLSAFDGPAVLVETARRLLGVNPEHHPESSAFASDLMSGGRHTADA